ncbi:MAG: pyrimidine/purine nucleoside phosphorylase [Bacteroidetes bacterium]|nr:pyrimidine/purine nucleoside phosphorylase [Bacteroidota bacterium]
MFKTNEYFDGNVKSIAFTSKDCPATIGVMAKGEYAFGTGSIEVMTITSGELSVKLPGETDWKKFKAFESFKVEKGVTFHVKADSDTTYLCLYK